MADTIGKGTDNGPVNSAAGADLATDWPEGLPASVESTLLKGGMICTTTRERLADGRQVVVKRCPYPAEVEAEGLQALAAAGAPTPSVLGTAGHTLVLEYVDGLPDWSALGRAMARTHRAAPIGPGPTHVPLLHDPPSTGALSGAATVDGTDQGAQLAPAASGRAASAGPAINPTAIGYGWHRDNPAGRFDQSNSWTDDWPTFFVQHRLLAHLADPMVPPALARRLRIAAAGPLPDLLPEHPQISLTHGDLWFGNVVTGRWVVDPAVCYADRELDLAFMQTGGLPDEFFDAYQREWPFEPGYERRRPALQLHKHLVGLRHFGPARLPRIEAVLDHYGW
ncbi:MAG: fructosamine kinase family protein [Nakamurella sp.]